MTVSLLSEFVDSTPLLEDAAALQARGQEDGMLFFRGLLPREEVMRVRRDILAICRRAGWLAKDASDDSGICDMDAVNSLAASVVTGGMGIPDEWYAEVQKLESFHRIAHHPNLLRMYRVLFDQPAFVHPRNIARVILPHKDNVPTPAHQDFIHVQGTTETWTCWFPLGDCPMELGGLTVLRASQTRGVRHIEEALGAGGRVSQICGDEREWVQGDYTAGDVLTFPSLTVHKALPNQLKNRVRLSCDFRYQRRSDPIENASLHVHGAVTTWDEIYAGWQDKSLQYYWKGKEPEIVPWDESIRWQKIRIC